MAELDPPSWLRTWVATLVTSTSMFASFGVSFGAILSFFAPYFGANPWSWFFAGACIPPGFMAFVYTTDWMFERRLDTLKRWRDEAKITKERYELDVERALEWRSQRLYGPTIKRLPQGKVRPKSKREQSAGSPEAEAAIAPAKAE